jgi:NitT/TauT family transport system substrate-binding protein
MNREPQKLWNQPMMIQFRNYAMMGLLMLGLLTPACSSSKTEPRPQDMITLKVIDSPYIMHGPFFIAQEEGFFAEQGLRIEPIRMRGFSDIVSALINKQMDVSGATVTIADLNGIARGARIKFVADKSYIDPSRCAFRAFMVRRVLVERGEMKDLAQLKDRRIAAFRDGGSGYFLEMLLSKAGLTMDDVETVQVPNEVLLDAMEKGTVDAAVVMEPMLTRLVQAGHAVVWGPGWDVKAGFQSSAISFGPTLLDENPDAGRRFMIAYLKAVRQFNQGKTERNLDIMVKYMKYDRELLKQMCWPPFRDDGKINIQSVLDYQDWAVKKGMLDRSLRVDEFWDPSFVEHANQALSTPAQSGAAK